MNDADPALERATLLCDLRRHDEALALLARVVAADPDNPDAWCLMAVAQLGLDRDHEALRAAETAIRLAPDAEWPHRLASIALQGLRRYEQAALEAREAVRIAPHAWQVHVRRAQASLRTGRLDEARSGSDRALALAPDEAEVHLTVGAVAAAAGHREEADAHFRRALEIDPDNAVAHNELARLQLKYGRPGSPANLARAAEGFATAVRSDPRLSASRRNLDLVVHAFLTRVAYVVFLGALLLARLRGQTIPVPGRVVVLVFLAGLCAFVGVFVGRLTRDLRRYLVRQLLGRRLHLAVGLDTLAIACLVASAAGWSGATSVNLAFVALGAALLARLLLLRERNRRNWNPPDESTRAGPGLEDLSAWAAMGSEDPPPGRRPRRSDR